jgi:hypothetical protein
MKKLTFVLLATVIGAGCFNQNACFTQTQGPTPVPEVSPSPTPSASPSPTATPRLATASVDVNQYGEACPSGITPSCTSEPVFCRTVRRGCTKALTCTAILEDGRDAGTVYPEVGPSSFSAVTGEGTIVRTSPSIAEPRFNRDAFALAIGSASYVCTYGGKTSAAFVLQVVE